MNAQPAIRALFVRATHELADNSMVLTMVADRLAYAAFAVAADVPDPSDPGGRLPSVMLLACEEPRHPEDDEDAMDRAAFAFLDDSLRRRTKPPTTALIACMRGLIATYGELQMRQHTGATP